MKVSVIIPVYNKYRYLPECLESLKKQTFKDLEIVVIDDGSTDKISDILSEFSIFNFQFSIFRQKHKGAGAARNLGAKQAKGEILVFVDSDMVFDKNFIKNLIQPIKQGRVKGTFSKDEYVANWSNLWAKCWNYNFGLKNKRKIPRNYPNRSPVFRAILKSEFLKAGGFEKTGYTDDWSLSEKLGYKASLAKGAFYYHYNPENLREVFFQAKWRAKRKYKGGVLGDFFHLLKSFLPISLIISFFKAVWFNKAEFLIFKIVFDFGSFVGLLEKILFKGYY